MKSIIIVLAIVAVGSLGYSLYQQSEVGALRAQLKEAQGRVTAAEAEATRQREISQQQKLAAEMAAVEARKAFELARQQVAECENRRRR